MERTRNISLHQRTIILILQTDSEVPDITGATLVCELYGIRLQLLGALTKKPFTVSAPVGILHQWTLPCPLHAYWNNIGSELGAVKNNVTQK